MDDTDTTSPAADAVITVTYAGRSVTITLDGDELSVSSDGNGYLSNASRHHIGDQVEAALVELAAHVTGTDGG